MVPAVGRAPLTVSFNGSGSYQTNGTIYSYAWDFDNDGTTDSGATNPTYTYQNTGSSAVTYTAKLTLGGAQNTTGSGQITTTVYPAASRAITVQNGTGSLPFQMTGSTISLTAGTPTGPQFNG